MELPSVRTSLHDPKTKITYHVMAYRSLAHHELVLAVRAFNAQLGKKKLKNGEEVIVLTSLGA